MTRWYNGRDVYEGLQQTRAELIAERLAWRRMDGEMNDAARALPREIDDAWRHLTEVIVPSLDAPLLDEAAARLALPHVAAREVQARRARDRAENDARRAAIEQDPVFLARDGRRNEAHIRLHELDEAIAPLEQSVRTLRAEPFFGELIETGYGTERYGVKFWQVSYYRHWKHGDRIVEAHGIRLGVTDFGGLREKFLREGDALAALIVAREEQRRALREIEEREEAHAAATQALQSLDARALGWARGRVREHLAALPPDEVTALLARSPTWRIAGVRVLGLEAKRTYLEEMRRQVLRGFDDEVRRALSDLDRQIAKMAKPKKWHERVDEQTYLKRIGRRRLEKWRRRRAEVDDARHAIQAFHAYETYDPIRDVLWWNWMTDHRHAMPFEPQGQSAALWGNDDDALQLAVADAGARARRDRTADRDVS